ncbi:small-subunit processome [Artomyces pyxidatus]|uniref:Small-subunit processome n=1 Tax=Artomyces pyxidatus TaxID=48021 RepID=A0ACB8TI77_9AGAM|nr:small-subunit processome [Artomyces pyxidatus]
MSSLRNSLHRRNHKERSQLAHRTRLGVLEKHKDYVLRARDYHSKQDRITRLRQKAADRNKDEFYFSMNKQRTEGGVHIQDRGNVGLPVDMVKILKSQDENYIRTIRTASLKKIEKLKGQLSTLADLLRPGSLDLAAEDQETLDDEELEILREAGVIAGPSNTRNRSKPSSSKHLIFAETEEEARQCVASQKRRSSSKNEGMEADHSPAADLGWKVPVVDKKKGKGKSRSVEIDEEQLKTEKELAAEERLKTATEHRSRLLKELSARLHRDRMLRYAERELEMQKSLMGKGGSKKIQGVEKIGGDSDDDDEDAVDARGGKRAAKTTSVVDEKAYKPRVYKWRAERKR